MVSSYPLTPPMAIHTWNPIFFFKISQINHTQLKNLEKASHHAQNIYNGEFSGGLVVRTLCFHCWGPGFNPGLGLGGICDVISLRNCLREVGIPPSDEIML